MAHNEVPSAVLSTLRRVEESLAKPDPAEALEHLRHSVPDDPLLGNARGVCLMRLGRVRSAIELYRSFLLDEGTLILKSGLPTVFLANYATALLLDENLDGCLTLLDEASDESHPSVARLRKAVATWRSGLRWWERLQFALYGLVPHAVALDFAPGELVIPADVPVRAA